VVLWGVEGAEKMNTEAYVRRLEAAIAEYGRESKRCAKTIRRLRSENARLRGVLAECYFAGPVTGLSRDTASRVERELGAP
jgi:hypothetical protein